jgi:hypothetical protein
MTALPWWLQDSHAGDDLLIAMRITDAEPITHVSPDTCSRCGGYGCDECDDCQCPAKACERKRRGRR